MAGSNSQWFEINQSDPIIWLSGAMSPVWNALVSKVVQVSEC